MNCLKGLITNALLTIVQISFACDLCSSYLGINPHYNKNSIGIRYRESSFLGEHTHFNDHNHDFSETINSTNQSKEVYRTTEIYGRWYPNPKLQLFYTIPFGRHTEWENRKMQTDYYGIKDVLAIGQFQLINTIQRDSSQLLHRLLIGGGIKLPTGTYKKKNSIKVIDPTMQLGSGSLDLMVAGTYLAKYKRLGWSTTITYSINGKNRINYRFANRLNITSQLFYENKIGKYTVMPSLGIYSELAQRDQWKEVTQYNTGGKVSFAVIGISLYKNNWAVNFNYLNPVYEYLFGQQGENQARITTGVSHAFN